VEETLIVSISSLNKVDDLFSQQIATIPAHAGLCHSRIPGQHCSISLIDCKQ